MAEYTLLNHRNPMIHTPTEKFDFSNPPIPPEDLADILRKKLVEYRGLGLSANQIGIPYSVFAISFGGDKVEVAFNPKIVYYGEESLELEEGCLTFPGIHFKVKRPNVIRARLTNEKGETQTQIFQGLTSRAIQHETDHCNGEIFTKGLSRLKIERLIKNAKRDFNIDYVVNDLYRR